MNLFPRFFIPALIVFLPVAAVLADAGTVSARMSIADFKAAGDGTTLNTEKIQSAIDQLASHGGGALVIPKGAFLTGALFLKPGVNLHLEKDAVLKASADMKDFPERRVRIEGHFEEHFAPALINADGCDGLSIDGQGILDGNGRPAWDRFWKSNAGNMGVPRPQLCIINNSKDVSIVGVTFKDSPFWNLHFYNSSNVLVQDARFQVPDDYKRAPSTDGIDVDSCQDVRIQGCYFSVTDDCVCLKGNRYDGLRQEPKSPPVRNVLVENCTFVRGDGALSLGTEAQTISDVEIRNCTVRGKMPMLRIKLRLDTPNQDYNNIYVHNMRLEGGDGEIVRVSSNHGTKVPTPAAPISKVGFIRIENISGTTGSFGSLSGGSAATVSDVTLRNIHVTAASNAELNTNGVSGLKFEAVSVQSAQSSRNHFENGAVTDHIRLFDSDGNQINAHDGAILYADGKYHWYGMALRPSSVKEGGQKTTTGVVMYASTNLYDWTYEGVVLACSTNLSDDLCGPMRFERPKIIYNAGTKRYVMWFHYVRRPGDHTNNKGGGEAGVASCGTVNGQYTFHGTCRPIDDRGVVRDSTLFEDDDGNAYFIYDRDFVVRGPDFGRVLHIVKLSDDYLQPTSTFRKIDVAAGREAPVMIKRQGHYFLISSGLTSWAFNRAKYFHATNIFGPYTDMGDPCVGEHTDTTFNAQGTIAFPVQGKPDQFIFLCERHNTERMTDSSFVFLPIKFPTPATLELHYLPEWKWESWPN